MLDAFAGSEQRPAGGTLPRVTKLGVHEMPGSGTPDELLDAAGISARHIVAAVKKLAG